MTFASKCQIKQVSLIFPANINILNDDIDCHNLKYMYMVHDVTLTYDTEGQGYNALLCMYFQYLMWD